MNAAAAEAREALPPGQRLYRWAEFAVLFFVLPTLYVGDWFPFPPVPLLVAVTVLLIIVMLRDPRFDKHQMWNAWALHGEWRRILATFAVCGALEGLKREGASTASR